LGYAVLGLLATEPRTGYELAQRMKAPIGWMWSAQHSQIYPELARLTETGLVRSTVIPGPGPRDTKRYQITTAGRRSLAAWADSPITEVMRSELMLRVRVLWLVSPDRARLFLEQQRQHQLDRLRVYAAEEADFARHGDAVSDPSSSLFFAYATLRFGIGRATQALAWCDWLLEQLAIAVDPIALGAQS